MKTNATKSKYRYYSPSLSRHMLPALDRHLAKVGRLKSVKAVCAGRGSGWYELVVTGEAGKLVLRGCSWGYYGEGCRATRDVLVRLGFPIIEAEHLAFTTPNKDVGGSEAVRSRRGKFRPAALNKVYFERELSDLPALPYDVRFLTESRRTVESAVSPVDALLRAGVLGCDGYSAVALASPVFN